MILFQQIDKIRIVEWSIHKIHIFSYNSLKYKIRNDKKILPRPGFEPTPAQGEQQFDNSYVKM